MPQQPSLAQELFSSAEMQTASGAEDMKVDATVEAPKVSEDELSQEQRGMMQDLINKFEFPDQLVLKAFEECKENASKYDIQNWCLENLDKYAFESEAPEGVISDDDDEDDRKSDASSMESEDEGYSYLQQATPLSVSGMSVLCVCMCVCIVCECMSEGVSVLHVLCVLVNQHTHV